MKAFKAYDIRGVWGKDLTPELVYKVGYYLPEMLQAKCLLVGRDCRNSSDTVFEALSDGITDSGAMVHDAGLTTTPLIYWATAKMKYDGSVMITASHNPKEHNGLKISGRDAIPVGYESGLNTLESLVLNGVPHIGKQKGKVVTKDVSRQYLSFLNQYASDFDNLKISVDCSNGMASLFAEKLFGNKGQLFNHDLNGNFPAHEPNPLEPENRQQIIKHVLHQQSDLGLIFDGDADRVMFIDEKGGFVSPDLIIALLGHYFFGEQQKSGKVLQDIRSSRAIGEYLQANFGAKVETWRVGRAYGAQKLREIDGIYGGELAGHYYFRDFYYSDSGLLAALIVLKLVAQFKANGLTMSQIIGNISSYYNSGEINFMVNAKDEAMHAVVDYYRSLLEPENYYDFDGYRLDYKDWWFNIRPSNTEPFLRFIAEAKSHEKLLEIEKNVREIIKKFDT